MLNSATLEVRTFANVSSPKCTLFAEVTGDGMFSVGEMECMVIISTLYLQKEFCCVSLQTCSLTHLNN